MVVKRVRYVAAGDSSSVRLSRKCGGWGTPYRILTVR